MSHSSLKRRALPLALSTLAAGAAVHSSPALAASKAKTFKGPVVYDHHGELQVSITVKSKKIIKVSVAASPEPGRSEFIQEQAIPLLKQETLQARSANISLISGAT